MKKKKLTVFGSYLKKKQLSGSQAAKVLGTSRAYVRMLATGATTPSLHLAWRIERWSRRKVTMQSWLGTTA